MTATDPKRTLAESPVSRARDSPEAPEIAYIEGQEIASPHKGRTYKRVLTLIENLSGRLGESIYEADLCNWYGGNTGYSSYPQFTIAASIAERYSMSHHSDFLGHARNGTDGRSWSILWRRCLKSSITPVHDVLYV